jgi:dihydroorotase
MSKFLALGMSLEDVVAKATVEPAKIIGKVPGLGTLQVGAPADVAIFDYVDGPVCSWTRATTGATAPRSWSRC